MPSEVVLDVLLWGMGALMKAAAQHGLLPDVVEDGIYSQASEHRAVGYWEE